jgi:mRNA interferase YafQ
MREIRRSGAFKRHYKLMIKRGKDIDSLDKIIELLAYDLPLPPALKDHSLSGQYKGFRDCHVEPDWVLIYKKEELKDGQEVLSLLCLEATGTHSDLF